MYPCDRAVLGRVSLSLVLFLSVLALGYFNGFRFRFFSFLFTYLLPSSYPLSFCTVLALLQSSVLQVFTASSVGS